MHNFIVRSSIASGGGEWGKSTETKDIDKWMLTQQSSFLSQEDAGCFTRVTKKKQPTYQVDYGQKKFLCTGE